MTPQSTENPTVEAPRLGVFSSISETDHEQIVFCNAPELGLRAIIAVHDTTLGPAAGGVRMLNYATESEALDDVIRLSRGMTYKNALAGINLGGGKAVIIGDPKTMRTEALLRRFGSFVQTLGGRYYTAEDVNLSVKEISYIQMETPYVLGVPQALGGTGDPSPMTAQGVYIGIKSAAKHVFGTDRLENKRILIQGIGHVGKVLMEKLHKEKAQLMISDISERKLDEALKQYNVQVIPNEDIFHTDMDIFVPCALGGIINAQSIPHMRCAIVAGAANNQLQNEIEDAQLLKDKGIVYAPDFVINSGGIIMVYYEYLEADNCIAAAQTHIEHIYDQLQNVLAYSDAHNISTYTAAMRLASARIDQVKKIPRIQFGNLNPSATHS